MDLAGRLEHFLRLTRGAGPDEVALRALTLHMLRHRAPAVFAARALEPVLTAALEACARVDLGLSAPLDEDRLQTGVDAWYLRHVYGLPHAPPEPRAFRAALEQLVADDCVIYAWLLGELAARCGLDVRVEVAPRPYRHLSRLHDGYWLTHLVLLDTEYLARPPAHPEREGWRDELGRLVPWLERNPNLDLLGEVALCLDVLGGDAGPARALLLAAPVGDDAHQVAAGLLALSVP